MVYLELYGILSGMSGQAGVLHWTSDIRQNGRPIFDKTVINLPEGKTFTIVTKNNSADNKYIESATLNGEPLDKPFLEHKAIAAGGVLEITMTGQPTKWGV